MNLIPILILFGGGVILTAGDVIFKHWVEKGGTMYSVLYIVGILLYLVGSMFLVASYKYNMNIVEAGVIQGLFNTIILVFFTYFYFKEPLSLSQIVGILLGVVSIYLISQD